MFKSAPGLVTITLEAASATNTLSAAVDIVGSAVALATYTAAAVFVLVVAAASLVSFF